MTARVAEILLANVDLIKHALDDAGEWREQLDDVKSAEAYQILAGAIEDAEEGP